MIKTEKQMQILNSAPQTREIASKESRFYQGHTSKQAIEIRQQKDTNSGRRTPEEADALRSAKGRQRKTTRMLNKAN
jgi:hypothetical protein